MDLKNLLKKEYIIGLDIGSSSVKMAEFASRDDGLHLVRTDLKEIPQAHDEESREKETLSALKGVLKGVDLRRSRVAAGINCPKTAIKIVRVPYMPKSELGEGIRLEAKSYFPFPIDDAVLDFEIFGETVEKGARLYDVAVAVSPRGTVNKYLSLLEKAGVKPTALVPPPIALYRLCSELYSKEKKTVCFIELGGAASELVICRGEALIFSRKIPVTGNDFTTAMTGALASERGRMELSLEEAENIKKKQAYPLRQNQR